MMARGMPEPTVDTLSALRVGIDQMGYLREATFTGDDLADAIDAFKLIQVGEETNEFVTDNYNYIVLEFADGESYTASINLRSLELSTYNNYHIYALENLGTLWAMAEEAAVELTDGPGQGS